MYQAFSSPRFRRPGYKANIDQGTVPRMQAHFQLPHWNVLLLHTCCDGKQVCYKLQDALPPSQLHTLLPYYENNLTHFYLEDWPLLQLALSLLLPLVPLSSGSLLGRPAPLPSRSCFSGGPSSCSRDNDESDFSVSPKLSMSTFKLKLWKPGI